MLPHEVSRIVAKQEEKSEKAPKLKDQKDKESYSRGYQFGQSMKSQGLDINLNVYTAGIKAALAGTKPLISKEEITKTVTAIQERVLAARQKALKEIGEKNLAEGKAFLEANKKAAGIVTLPSGLQYKVLKEGSGSVPKVTDEVTVNYISKSIDGTEFDNSYKKGSPVTVKVDKLIPGWIEAFQLMKEGSRWQLFIPSALGYGDRMVGPILPNTTLVCEVELISIKGADAGTGSK